MSDGPAPPPRQGGQWVRLALASLGVMLGIVCTLNAGRYGASGLILGPLLVAAGGWAVRRGFRPPRPIAGR